MFSPAKAITAGALVFAIGGVMLMAQPFHQQGSVPKRSNDGRPGDRPVVLLRNGRRRLGHRLAARHRAP